ncbi:tetraspanin-8 isoform X1 [Megalopta genalis]|uniref:tetraspanin-8 isoform X1 n=2 Tax=Megalopta genalis TaxID=115081 RepID=UPI001442FD0D|nr:tetraspanin-8-like [Megalopta genalis]
MVLSGCYGSVKYALIFINLIFGIVGLAVVGLIMWLFCGQTFLMSLSHEQHHFTAGLFILLAAGHLMLIVSFLGCWGAIRGSQCMLVCFFSCLLVVFVAQIAAGARICTSSGSLKDLVKSSMIITVKNKYGVEDSYTQTVDSFQSELGCCGATGPSDWAGSKYSTKDPSLPVSLTVSGDPNNVYTVPESCCRTKDSLACTAAREIRVASDVNGAIYNEGCIDKLIDVLSSQKNVIIGIVAAIGILELLGLIFSLVLCCAIGSSDRYKA